LLEKPFVSRIINVRTDRQNLNAENSGKHLPHELSKLSKPPFGINSQPEPDEVEIEERKAMSMDSVPEPYLDGWARLQCQRPAQIAEAVWRQAIDDRCSVEDSVCYMDLRRHRRYWPAWKTES
jgi:hypothetical protein